MEFIKSHIGLTVFAVVVVAIVIFSIAYSAGESYGKSMERDFISSGLDSELSEKQQYESNLEKYIKYKDSYDSELSSDQAVLDSITSQADAMKKSLTQNGKPITLPAGKFVVGKDIPSGRYNVTGTSNFMVDGSTDVNTILKGPDCTIGVSEYVCTLSDGDSIDAHGSDTFTPVN